MIAVIFEVEPHAASKQAYLDIAAGLRTELDTIDGFVSIERFVSMSSPDRILSLSFWRDEEAHRTAQARGRATIFRHYRLRVAQVVRDYGLHDRDGAPADCRARE